MHNLDDLLAGNYAGTTRLSLACGLETVPEAVFDLADTLEVLDLSNNRLHTLPDDFAKLKKLKIFFGSQNDFERFPDILAHCPELEMIGFKSCRIADVPENAFPPKLRWLILTDNRIETIPEGIGDSHRLQKCMLAGNRLGTLPDTMRNCRNIELLRISANRFEAVPEWVFSLPRLAWLAAAGNALTPASSAEEALPLIGYGELILDEQLGCGASGDIYRAHWQGEAVAVKIFKGSVTSDGYPADEMAAALAAGNHPNLVRVLARIEADGERNAGLVFALIPPDYTILGNPPSLQSCSRDTYSHDARFTPEQVRAVAEQVASAMAHLHARGIMHGDLYAHNILINPNNHLLLSDFGGATRYAPADSRMERLDTRAFGCLLEELLERCDTPPEDLIELRDACMSTTAENRPLFARTRQEPLR